MGRAFPVTIEYVSKTREEYRSPAYLGLDLPYAPAIMVGEEVVVEGKDLSEEDLVAGIRRHLG